MPTVFITGASRGIGLELARIYAKDGAKVIACARNPARADALRALAREDNVEIEPLDVTSDTALSALPGRLGKTAIDILINNAGLGDPGPAGGDLLALDYKRFEELITVNALAPLKVAAALYPNIKAGQAKKIVTVSSRLGSIGLNVDGALPTYRASKAMVNQLMRSLAARAKRDAIAVMVVHPGWVRTDMGGAQASLSPTESATALKRIISDLDLAHTGSFVNYDGDVLPW